MTGKNPCPLPTGPPCPVCTSSRSRLVEEIDVGALNRAWRRVFGVQRALDVQRLSYLQCMDCQLGFFHPPHAGKADLYEHLQQFEWYYLDEKPEYRHALKYLLDRDSILEVGAGAGAFSQHVSDKRYVGLDTNPSAVQEATSRGIDVRGQTLAEHADEGHLYGAVVAFQVLEHVESPTAFLRTCLACLEPGGILLVALPSAHGFVGHSVNNLLNMPPHHVTHWHDRTFEVLAERLTARLVALEHESIAEHHVLWARAVAIERRIRRVLGLRSRIFDPRLRARFVAQVSALLARLSRSPIPQDSLGHTVIAVLKPMPEMQQEQG